MNLRPHTDSHTSAVHKREMGLRHDQKFRAPVQPSVKSKVSFLRIDMIVCGIIAGNDKDILLSKVIRKIDTKKRIASFMMHQMFSVQGNIGRHRRCRYFKENFLLLFGRRPAEFFNIAAGSAEIIISAVHPVLCIPGMRQRDCHAVFFLTLNKRPILIKVDYSAHHSYLCFILFYLHSAAVFLRISASTRPALRFTSSTATAPASIPFTMSSI